MELLAVVLAALCVLGAVLTALLVRSRRSHKSQPFRPYIPADAPIKNVSSDHRGKRIGVLIVAYNALTTLSAVLKRISHIQRVSDRNEENHDAIHRRRHRRRALGSAEEVSRRPRLAVRALPHR